MARPTLHGGQIHITIVTPDKVDEAAKVIRVHEIHNETLCSVTSYLDGSPVEQGAGGNEGQHPYDTSPHAQEHQNEARSTAIGGTIVIEIHNETRLIENRYFTSRAKTAEGTAVPDAAKKRKQPSSVKVKKGTTKTTTAAAAAVGPKKARLAIEAAKPASASSVAAAARQARQSRRSAGATSSEDSVVGGPTALN